MIVETEKDSVSCGKRSHPVGNIQSVRTDCSLGTQDFGCFEGCVNFRVSIFFADIHVVSEDGDTGGVEFRLDLAVVLGGRAYPPFAQLLPRLLRAHAGSVETRLAP